MGRTKNIVFEAEAMLHFAQLSRAALCMTRSKRDAEDLLQDTFMQAWKSFDKYTPGTNCRAWLYSILINKNSSSKRKRFAQSKNIQDVDEFVLKNATSRDSISEHLTDKTVIGAIDELPEHYRQVILLVDVYGFKYKEVSEFLHIAIGTVMSRVSRARSRLRIPLVKSDGLKG